jgi:hypothetical protein
MAKEKSKLTFRKLTADEIEVRVGSGNSLLLYKTARTDANILDETVGAENWQKKYTSVMTTMFCSLGININYDDPSKEPVWVWKEDAGDDDYTTEKVKAQASDCFKRAGFAWGIGRELYTSPRIKLDEANKSKSFFECERIGYDEDGHINDLKITTDFGKTVVYEMVNGRKLKQGETHNAPNRAKNTPNNAISLKPIDLLKDYENALASDKMASFHNWLKGKYGTMIITELTEEQVNEVCKMVKIIK